MADGDGVLFNVPSLDEQGETTAGQANADKPPRRLDDSLRRQLRGLSKTKKVDVTAVIRDGEAYQFAHEIKAFLRSEGFEVEGVNQVMFSGPVRGQHLRDTPEATRIVIGNQE